MTDEYRMIEEAEQAVIGAMLASNDLIGEVTSIIKREDFFFERHKILFSAIVYKYSLGDPVDIITIRSYLMENEKYDAVGGSVYLSTITDQVPDVANAGYYAEEVKKFSIRRHLSSLASNINKRVGLDTPYEVIDNTMAELMSIADMSVDNNQVPVGDEISKEVDYLISLEDGGQKEEILGTGFKTLDAHIGGLRPGEMYVIAARPSLGKTAFVTNMALNISKRNVPVLFFSLEMGRRQLVRRILAQETGIAYRSIEEGLLGSSGVDRVRAARDRLRTVPFIIDDNANQSLASIRTKCRRQQARSGLGLIMLDYLQLAPANPEDRTEISMWSKGLRAIGKDLGVPVVAVAQLSRGVEYRDDPRPVKSDLRGSGQIEQDADVVMFLYNKDPHDTLRTTLYIAKQRNGPCGDIELSFNNETTQFVEDQ